MNGPVGGRPAEVCGERGLGLRDEGVGLRGAQPALDGHHPLGGYMTGVNREHRLVFLSQDRVDVPDEEPAAGVPAFEGDQMTVDLCHRLLAFHVQVRQQETDLGQCHVRRAQHPDELPNSDLTLPVPAMAVERIDLIRP